MYIPCGFLAGNIKKLGDWAWGRGYKIIILKYICEDMANKGLGSNKGWNEQRSNFNDLYKQWQSNKEEWWIQQKERERLQKEWKALVEKQQVTLNVLTLGITYVTGVTDDHVELENILRNLEYTKNSVVYAKKTKEFLASLRKYKTELSQKRHNIHPLSTDRDFLLDASRDHDILMKANRFYDEEMNACRKKIDSCDTKLVSCNSKLDEIEDEMRRCESLERDVLNEI